MSTSTSTFSSYNTDPFGNSSSYGEDISHQELFLNAEYSRKILKSKFQKNKLEELFENINQLYRDSYDKYLHDNKMNSGALLVDVHEKITEEDNRLLKSMATSLKVFHKKGMLHQLANSKEYDIWWGAQRIQD